MKTGYLFLLLSLCFAACDSAPKEPKVVTVNANDLMLGPVVHDSLNADQLEKIKIVQETFVEVYPVSLEVTITNFKKDETPDKEIQVWLDMASAYQQFLAKNSSMDSLKKRDVFQLLLVRSMMPDKEAIKASKVKHLSGEEIREVLHYYNSAPVPLKVHKK